MNTRKIIQSVAAITIAAPLTIGQMSSYLFGESCYYIGNSIYCSDGFSGYSSGNSFYGNDGYSSYSSGNSIYGNDGFSGYSSGNSFYTW